MGRGPRLAKVEPAGPVGPAGRGRPGPGPDSRPPEGIRGAGPDTMTCRGPRPAEVEPAGPVRARASRDATQQARMASVRVYMHAGPHGHRMHLHSRKHASPHGHVVCTQARRPGWPRRTHACKQARMATSYACMQAGPHGHRMQAASLTACACGPCGARSPADRARRGPGGARRPAGRARARPSGPDHRKYFGPGAGMILGTDAGPVSQLELEFSDSGP